MRNLVVSISLISSISVAPSVYADCKDVIALSKISTTITQDSSQLESEARSFCRDYASAKAKNSSLNVGLSYASLGLSVGSANASAEQVADKYCDKNDLSKARSDAYRQYVESIAPGAFSAYERCETLRGSGIDIAVDRNAVLPKFFIASVSFQRGRADEAKPLSAACNRTLSANIIIFAEHL